MKINDGYLLDEIDGDYVLFPVGQNAADLKKIVSVNDAGRFIVEKLSKGITYGELLAQVIDEFEATDDEQEEVKTILDKYLDGLRTQGIIEE